MAMNSAIVGLVNARS